MIHIPTAPWAHYVGDVAAWAAAALALRWQQRRWPEASALLARITSPSYFIALALGALVGAWLLGSANSLHSTAAAPSHSVAGALVGGIAAIEMWKWRHAIRQSTGGGFVLPLALGIAIGRMGCLFSGLADYTYGTPTALPWAVDMGDRVGRHPVAAYEGLAMAGFAAVYLHARIAGKGWALHHAFHALVIVYAAQRFCWEFLKPYPRLVGPFNLFHFVMLGLILYGIIWWRRADRAEG